MSLIIAVKRVSAFIHVLPVGRNRINHLSKDNQRFLWAEEYCAGVNKCQKISQVQMLNFRFFTFAGTGWLKSSETQIKFGGGRFCGHGPTPSSLSAMIWQWTQRVDPRISSISHPCTCDPVHQESLCSFGLSLQGKNDQVKARAPDPSFSLLGQSFSSHKAQPRLEPFPLFIFRLSYYAHNLDSLLFLHHNFPSFSAEAHTHWGSPWFHSSTVLVKCLNISLRRRYHQKIVLT